MYQSRSYKHERSVDKLFNMWYKVRSENQEALKGAMYNFLIVAGLFAFGCVCVILGPFIRPLIWAFLVGAVLFPFKRKLASLLNGWFCGLEENDTNVFVALFMAPIQTCENSGSQLVCWAKKHWQILLGGISIFALFKILWLYAPRSLFCWIWKTVLVGHSVFAMSMNLISIYLLVTLLCLYITSVYILWRPENAQYFVLAGQSLYIFLAGYVCSYLGTLQVPIFMAVMLYVLASIFYHIQKTGEDSGVIQSLTNLLDSRRFSEALASVYKKNQKEEETPTGNESQEKDHFQPAEENLSNFYFKLLFYACIATFLYRNIWMFFLAFIPVLVHLFYVLCKKSGLWQFMEDKFIQIFLKLKTWALHHHSAVLPLCLPGILEINYKTQIFIRSSLKSSVDLVTSVIMIILMILIVIAVGVFMCVNIYSETIDVAYLGKDLINKTITDRPELIDVLPANIQSSIDDVLDNAHHYGRRRIEQYIDDLLKDADPIHGNNLKFQILNVFDRVIQYWIDLNKTDTFGPRVPTDAIKSTFGEIVDNPGYFKELVLVAKQGIIGWAKSNTNTIMEVADSLWHIIRTNISMILSFTGEIFSLLLSGGQAFVEFFLDLIVFFTALFYLLSSSNEKYAPLQATSYLGVSSGIKIADTLEDSISGVLIAMFKSALFQGCFTWLIHIVFGARIVFLPSALAAFLSAAPFLGSYWCALPAFLELWLAQDRFYVGLLLFLLLFFVPPHVEQEIHAEMKGGGHPYLTGLAIAGGMYWLGWQGAIFGPLMLCFFIGIFEVASVALKPPTENENVESPSFAEEDTRPSQSVCLKVVKKTISTLLPHKAIPWKSLVNKKSQHLIEQPTEEGSNVTIYKLIDDETKSDSIDNANLIEIKIDENSKIEETSKMEESINEETSDAIQELTEEKNNEEKIEEENQTVTEENEVFRESVLI